MTQGSALAITGLSKSFGLGFLRRARRPALVDLNLHVERQEIFGYLGPNGSGKTTTLKLLMGMLRPDAGDATILGLPLSQPAWRFKIGYLPENPYLYDYLTAREYLTYVGSLFGLDKSERRRRAGELLERVDMAAVGDWPMRRYSKGMLQRVGIAQALVNRPEMVFLDEPMSGLDPIGRKLVRDLILELKSEGRTVFFSTHILPDAEALCDRVALLREGRLVEVGALDQILSIDVAHLEVLVAGLGAEAVKSLPGLHGSQPVGERWRLAVDARGLAPVVQAVETGGGRVLGVSPVRQSLEEVFVRQVGGGKEAAWVPVE
jgi:ABC-2 type transport system ATP-binding protein